MMINVEQFAEWKEHPVTKEVFLAIRKTIEDLKDKLIDGQTLSNHADVTHGLTSKTIGQIDGLNQLLNMYFEDDQIKEKVNEVSGY